MVDASIQEAVHVPGVAAADSLPVASLPIEAEAASRECAAEAAVDVLVVQIKKLNIKEME